jgi:hypothetical protein
MIIPMDAPLVIRRNDNPFRVLFVFENPDGSVIDMTGVTAKWQARLYPGAPGGPLLEATTGELVAPRLIASGLGIELILTNAAIETLPPGEPGLPSVIHHDLLITMDGDENAWAVGAVTVEWGVTND